MTCEECLSELATGSLREMSGDSAVMQHCATCPDCSRLTTLLRDREYEAATVLNNLPPMSNPIAVAEASVLTAHRRRVGGVVVMLSGADRKSTRLNSSHLVLSYAVFCLNKKTSAETTIPSCSLPSLRSSQPQYERL